VLADGGLPSSGSDAAGAVESCGGVLRAGRGKRIDDQYELVRNFSQEFGVLIRIKILFRTENDHHTEALPSQYEGNGTVGSHFFFEVGLLGGEL